MASKTDRIMCGTCQYWIGKRNPIFDAKGMPKVDIVDEIGECQNGNSEKFCGVLRKKEAKCKHFSKWTELL